LLGRVPEPLLPVIAQPMPMVQRRLMEPIRHRDLLDRTEQIAVLYAITRWLSAAVPLAREAARSGADRGCHRAALLDLPVGRGSQATGGGVLDWFLHGLYA